MENLYCLYDQVAGTMLKVFQNIKDEVVIRDLKIALQKGSDLKDKAVDLDLYKLGTITLATGEIVAHKEFIIHLSELING